MNVTINHVPLDILDKQILNDIKYNHQVFYSHISTADIKLIELKIRNLHALRLFTTPNPYDTTDLMALNLNSPGQFFLTAEGHEAVKKNWFTIGLGIIIGSNILGAVYYITGIVRHCIN